MSCLQEATTQETDQAFCLSSKQTLLYTKLCPVSADAPFEKAQPMMSDLLSRTVERTEQGVRKEIPDVQGHLDKQCTTFNAIKKAYAASQEATEAAIAQDQQPCLITCTRGFPRMSAGLYTVITSPLGFDPILYGLEVQHLPSGVSRCPPDVHINLHLSIIRWLEQVPCMMGICNEPYIWCCCSQHCSW